MEPIQPEFKFEEKAVPHGWTIVAVWPTGVREPLAGLFLTAEHARQWLVDGADQWLAQRKAPFGRPSILQQGQQVPVKVLNFARRKTQCSV